MNYNGTINANNRTINKTINSTINNSTNNTINISDYAGKHFGSIFLTIVIALSSGFVAGFAIKFCNCNVALSYFNDSEFFDVNDSEPFPWKDEKIKVELKYNQENV